mmetsp:Transcript_9699/g.27006  ORF Transcript_9699/g.27006 Transcript_9699/m.27006 type:complete len:96 (+) Transcript_9699:142-429(+)
MPQTGPKHGRSNTRGDDGDVCFPSTSELNSFTEGFETLHRLISLLIAGAVFRTAESSQLPREGVSDQRHEASLQFVTPLATESGRCNINKHAPAV